MKKTWRRFKLISFFDKSYQTPRWFDERCSKAKMSRRSLLKSAAGASALSLAPTFSWSETHQNTLNTLIKSEPWQTIDATLKHLLPKSSTGPSAEEINALAYLYQVMTVQPTEQDEKDFILKGVGWLNGYATTEHKKKFVQLSFAEKEELLRNISRSRAGENWLNTLLNYIFEAMFTPQSYGGNPNGIGEKWLEHQAGFPLPKKGQRYFELPTRGKVGEKIAFRNIDAETPKIIKPNVIKSSKA